jgi:hypothetical protein
MRYHADLTPYAFVHGKEKCYKGELHIGWLDSKHAFEKGDVPTGFLDRLWLFNSSPTALNRGIDIVCDLCDVIKNKPFIIRYANEDIVIGFGQIRVFGTNGKVYAAPDAIFHFVTEHSYKPPEEFVEAVLNGPTPTSQEYQELLVKLGYRTSSVTRKIEYCSLRK